MIGKKIITKFIVQALNRYEKHSLAGRRKIKPFINFFQPSERAGIQNPQILSANHAHVTGPAFYDTAHEPDFFPAA